jgi:hypothetical protein
MNKPQTITINDDSVYNAEEVYNYDKNFFIGCARVRLIIEKKKLKEDDYFFAYQKNNKWIKSTANYPRAKLYLKESYVVHQVPKFMDKVKQELYKYEEAPDILELEDEEKFKNKDGKFIEIEVRGERKHNNSYFKVKDISIGFDMPNLNTVLTNKENTYEKNIDYKTFIINKSRNNESDKSKIHLFMTYEGIIKLLYISRNSNAKYFRDWATEKLFTIQMGTEEKKDELAGELIGVQSETIKNVFRRNTSKTPCVYLYLIGKANDLLEGTYNSDDLLCKFGCTNDLPRRSSEHQKIFKKDLSVDIELLYFSIIEAQYIFEAEKNISQYFKGNLIEYNNMKELIIINKKDLPQIKQHYRMIQNSYIGRYEEMNNKIIILEKEIIELNNKIVLKDKDIEILQEKHKNELQSKDIEILQAKLKFYESVK